MTEQDKHTTIKASNLAHALALAITVRTEYESKHKYVGESALLAGWKMVLEALHNGDIIEVEN